MGDKTIPFFPPWNTVMEEWEGSIVDYAQRVVVKREYRGKLVHIRPGFRAAEAAQAFPDVGVAVTPEDFQQAYDEHVKLEREYDMEAAAIAGLAMRKGNAPSDVPRDPFDDEDIDYNLKELVNQYPDEDWHTKRVDDWLLAVDELLACCEWARMDIALSLEWEILLGCLRGFPEPFGPEHRKLARAVMGKESIGENTAVFWTLVSKGEA